jgi:UDP-glucose 4-epimerase
VKEIIDAVKKELGAEFNVAQSSPRQGEYAKIYADNSLAKNALGWMPGKTLEESINSLAAWYRSHPGGYKN